MKFFALCLAAFGANPYRRGLGALAFMIKCAQYILASLELAAVNWLPFYRRRFDGIPKPRLMIIGAQKAGTTWIDRELRKQGLVALPDKKELHHFDRGRAWTIRGYLAQFDPSCGPIVEVAPDYGPLALWRIKAIGRLCPDLRAVFIAKHPAHRLWSGLRMETGFDRRLEAGAAIDHLRYLRLPRTRRYQDYAGQISRWQSVLGSTRLRVIPFEEMQAVPEACLKSILDLAGAKGAIHAIDNRRAFQGQPSLIGESLAAMINAQAQVNIDDFAAISPSLQSSAAHWRKIRLEASPQNERHLLYVCGFNPNPKAMSSGQKLAFDKIKELSERFASVQVIAFRNRLDRLDPMDDKWPSNVTLEMLDLSTFDRVLGGLRYPHLPAFVSARLWRGRRSLSKHMNSCKYTDFYADFSQGLGAIPAEYWPLFTFRQHDIVSNLYRRRALQGVAKSAAFGLEAWRSRRWERRAWQYVCRIETLSESDCEFVANYTDRPAKAAPVRGTFKSVCERRPVAGRIVFWGNMARDENEDAALHLIHTLYPAIKQRCPHAHLWIVGAHPGSRLTALAGPNVTITGFVDDPASVLATADIALVPLRLGSGVKIKVFETIDLQIPTIVSLVGGEGIPDHPCLIRTEDDRELVAEAVALLAQSVPTGKSASLEACSGNFGPQLDATVTFV